MNYRLIDALKILEISRDRLFYWIKFQRLTIPEVHGEGKGTRSRLSILNIIELSIAKELANLGIELAFVRKILETIVSPFETDKEGRRKRPKKPYKRERLSEFIYNEYRKKEKERDFSRFYLIIFKNKKNEYQFFPLGFVLINLDNVMKLASGVIKAMVVVNVFEIIKRIEEKLDEKI